MMFRTFLPKPEVWPIARAVREAQHGRAAGARRSDGVQLRALVPEAAEALDPQHGAHAHQ
eukprot:scaffold10192_cov59-Phaeocystis_antarctica.AAC.6